MPPGKSKRRHPPAKMQCCVGFGGFVSFAFFSISYQNPIFKAIIKESVKSSDS
jgi:hypothetical protein